MVKLLECQKEALEEEDNRAYYSKEDLKAFAITILCHMLEIFESDLSTEEERDLEIFIKDWCEK